MTAPRKAWLTAAATVLASAAAVSLASDRPQMSAATAANYTPQKYLAGRDGWNPVQ